MREADVPGTGGEPEAVAPFELRRPAHQTEPFVFNSPHSGRVYPDSFLKMSRLDRMSIRRSEDHYVDELFAGVIHLGAPMLAAQFPRAWLDVNREPYELDPRMFDGALPSFANIGSMRVAGGLGTIPRLVAENMDIYRERLSVEEGLSRIERVYRPYHATLRRIIAQTHVQFGKAILIDCHSMPANVRVAGGQPRPDIIIGDRYGASAAHDLSRAAVSFLSELGYRVVRNKPYAGGFITEHYGRPARGLHALQIEVNRGLYVDETTLERTAGFDLLKADLTEFAGQMMAYVRQDLSEDRLAAE
ncbi:MAG: N-formylglutamate amidohydrolase [Hoeflea sp.]|uniref:N-formylglutamate amidohydrolase n=1 Tax=Hoeflea sp. TaxID=1940281 RepID=UPI001D3F7EE6|nr:N-formylglutamate amidohydrolase [Hoeflea sp.]MBU4528217.1 N-formylglutamate amidohydrolase [Alphaproteobacteria bacterium]MBU4543813.1 N-formylglutamate amidohydrolase [Alphaproteobacteria bacterium]MBU4548454.1 N-formylglutamate amidohydrolase [Alphaproteobacteria bacterium]MBV1722533.1 N-formylglutamate amidohydrolase [Hoeflea sp.]MBV1762202.1 N-formylglutamate amidohydrolase [Hoeflea sp.]